MKWRSTLPTGICFPPRRLQAWCPRQRENGDEDGLRLLGPGANLAIGLRDNWGEWTQRAPPSEPIAPRAGQFRRNGPRLGQRSIAILHSGGLLVIFN